jgi:hypothetical protein
VLLEKSLSQSRNSPLLSDPSPPLVPILSRMNPVHNLLPRFSKVISSIIVPSTPGSCKWSFLY